MRTILEGQISFGGVHDALDAVARHKNVKHGVLRISSNEASGLIGVFCGRYITGAFVSLTGETGHAALQRLIGATDGEFAFMDAMGYETPELKQSLAVDISALAASGDQASLGSEESLTGSTGADSELVQLIDTSASFDQEAKTLADDELSNRLKRTYDKILSVSEFEKMRRATAAESSLTDEADVDHFDGQRMRRQAKPSASVELTEVISRGSKGDAGKPPEFNLNDLRSREWALRSSAPPLSSKPIEAVADAAPGASLSNAADSEEETLVHAFGTVGYINQVQQEIVESSDDDYENRHRGRPNKKPVAGDFDRLKRWPSRSHTMSRYALMIMAVVACLGIFMAYQRVQKQPSGHKVVVPAKSIHASGRIPQLRRRN